MTADSLVPKLEGDLRRHLAMIEREARVVRRALKVLQAPATGRASHAAHADDLRATLVATPGTRASVLALCLGRDVDYVRQELEILEGDGIVERDGLGWRLT